MLRPTLLPLFVAAALCQLPRLALADRVCDLGDARQFSPIRELCPVVDGLARIQIDYRWGFVDTSGKLAIAPQFEEVTDFSEGFAAARLDDKWGFIDKQGKWVVPPTLQELEPLSMGLAAAVSNGKAGYIDATGKWVIAPRFTDAGDFSANAAVVQEADDSRALIARDGRIIKRFASGVVPGRYISRDGLINASVYPPAMLVNVDGRRLADPKDTDGYHAGLLIAKSQVKRGGEDVDVFGLMDMSGKLVVPAAYVILGHPRNSLWIAAPLPSDAKAPALHGLLDRKGRFVVKPIYKYLVTQGDDFYVGTRLEGDKKRDVLSAQGKLLFTMECEELDGQVVAMGALTVMTGCGKSWLVHRDRGVVKSIDGEWRTDAGGDHLLLTQKDEEHDAPLLYELFDRTGRPVAAPDPKHAFFSQPFNHVGVMQGQSRALPLAIFGNYRSNAVGFLTRDYKLVTRPDWEYDSVLLEYGGSSSQEVEPPLIMKGKEGFGAVDLAGNWIIPPKFSELGHFKRGLAFASIDGDKVIVDASGKTYPMPEGLYRIERTGATTVAGVTEEGNATLDLKTGKLTMLPEEDADPHRTGEQAGGLTPTSEQGKWGLKNAAGVWVLAPAFKQEPKPLLHKERLLGWINTDHELLGLHDPHGRELVRQRFTKLAVDEPSGLLLAEQDGYLASVLSADGRQVLPPINGRYTGLGDGWFKTYMEPLRGLIDEKGDWVVKPGRVEFQLNTRYYPDPRPYTVVNDDMLVDLAGRVSTRTRPLSLNRAEPPQWWWKPSKEDGETVFYGFDFKERARLPGEATENTFEDGVIAFKPSAPEHDGKMGLADASGKVIGLYDYQHIDAMSDGMAKVSTQVAPKPTGKKGRAPRGEMVTRVGYLNRSGRLAVPLAFEDGARFAAGRATVVIDSGLAMIDDKGTIVLQGAWQCGRVPVLMDGKKNVLWPEEARGVTSCKR